MPILFLNDVTGGLDVGRDFSMIRIIGIFCFREHFAERRILGLALDLRQGLNRANLLLVGFLLPNERMVECVNGCASKAADLNVLSMGGR